MYAQCKSNRGRVGITELCQGALKLVKVSQFNVQMNGGNSGRSKGNLLNLIEATLPSWKALGNRHVWRELRATGSLSRRRQQREWSPNPV